MKIFFTQVSCCNGYVRMKATAEKAFKDSKSYDIGNGISGKQKAVFEVFIDNE